MNVALSPLLLAGLYCLAALWIAVSEHASGARRRAELSVVGLTLASIALPLGGALVVPDAGTWQWLPDGILRVGPMVTSLVCLVGVIMAPKATHGRATLARMLLMASFAEGFLATQHPLVLTFLWAASAYLGWQELRAACPSEGWHRVFAAYHVLSVGSFGVGAVLLWLKTSPELAVVLLLIGIGIREGVMPAHSWFLRFAEKVPMGVLVLFAGPQLGVYAHLELLPQSGIAVAHWAAAFGAVTAVLAAMHGLAQTNVRRAMAYLVLSQTGLVAFGLESHSPVGTAGTVLSWQVLALATSSFAMTVAAVEARRGTLELFSPSGNLGSSTPRLAVAFLLFGFASVGFPLTVGFIAEDLLVQGTVDEYPLLGLSLIVATAFNGGTVLRTFLYLFAGKGNRISGIDLSRRESLLVGMVIVVLLGFGWMPGPLIEFDSSPPQHLAKISQR